MFMSFSMKGYQIENFAGIPVYDKEQAMQGRVHYVTSHIMEEHDFSLVTLRMQLSGTNALSPISNPIMTRTIDNSISVKPFL